MYLMIRINSVLAVNVALCYLISLPIFAGKPSTGDGGTTVIPNSPTVQYRATYLDAPANLGADWGTGASDMNELGTAVGTAQHQSQGLRAVMWSKEGSAIDLNADPLWTDATTGDQVTGWTALIASSVNNRNQVVGLASASASHLPGLGDRAFVYDSITGFVLLPEVPGQTTVVSGMSLSQFPITRFDINDAGVAVCHVAFGADGYPTGAVAFSPPFFQPILLPSNVGGYHLRINNLGTISDQLNVVYPPYTQDDVVDLGSSGYRLRGLADNSDVVCGAVIQQGKGKNAIPAGAVRIELSSSMLSVFKWTGTQYGGSPGFHRVNDQGDMIFYGSEKVYKEAWGDNSAQLLDLRANEIVNWNANDAIELQQITNSNVVVDPDNTGHGAMCGTASGLKYRAFVIYPESEQLP